MLLGLSFPKPGISLLAWFIPGAWLWLAGEDRGGRWRTGFYGGLGFHLTGLHWLVFIPMPLHAVLAWIALSTFLALFVGAWCWVCWRIADGLFPGNPEKLREQMLRSTGWARFAWLAVSAAAWVAMEMVVGRIFTGFPWNFLGISQFKVLPLIQVASITGVYGVSFAVAWCSVSLVWGALAWRMKYLPLRQSMVPLTASGFVLLGLLAFGWMRLNDRPEPGTHIKMALVQPGFPQPLIWDPNEKTNRFNGLMELSRQALEERPDILAWPETSLPDFFTRYNTYAIQQIIEMTQKHRIWMVFGANDTRTVETNGVTRVDLYNSAFLVNPAGDLVSRYHKRRLVVFGEYLPLRDWFPALQKFRKSGGGLATGVRNVPFVFGPDGIVSSVLICFEDVFPHLTRDSTSVETDFLLNLTNDGWFGEGSAQWQHAAAALFRALENGIPLVRCTNNGLTCWVDSRGRLHSVYFDGSRNVHQQGFKVVEIPIAKRAPQKRTFYARNGDVFGWGCVTVTGMALAIALAFRRRHSK